jgi:hypothetical protein
MPESRTHPLVLINIVIAAGLALLLSPFPYGWLSTVGGIILLLILFSYDVRPQRSAAQSLAFSGVCGLCLVLAAVVLLQRLAERKELDLWLAGAWLAFSLLCFFVDRSRSSAPASVPMSYNPPLPVSPAPPAPQETIVPAAPAPIFRQQAAEPAVPAPVVEPPSATSVFAPAPVQPALAQERPAEPVQPAVVQGRPAEEVTIYVNVIGQGISLLRSVRAEHITRDIYRIIDTRPEGEIWRYEPGQMVRCRKQKLSNGKGLVAFEEIIPQQVS